MPDLAERIRLARRKMYPRMHQRDLAVKLKVTRSAIAQWETGASKPDLDRMERLAKVCKVDVRWLMTGAGNPYPASEAGRKLAAGMAPVVKTLQESVLQLQSALTPAAIQLAEAKLAGYKEGLAEKERPAVELPIYGKIAANFQPAYVAPMETLRLDKVFDPAKRYGLLVSGQSMAPTALEGDVCIVESVQWELPEFDEERGPADKKFWKALHGEIVCASLNGDDAILKRMHIADRKDTGFKISLVSDNPANAMIEVTRNDRLRIVGVVRHILRNPRLNK